MVAAPDRSGRKAIADRFFGYSAAILPTYYFKVKGKKRPIRIPNAYAVLMGLNRLAATPPATVRDGKISGVRWPSRTTFEAMLTTYFWTQNAKPTATLRSFKTLGYVKSNGHFEITKKGVGLLLKHAKAAFQFFTGIEPANLGKTDSEWIELNEKMFETFFLGDYGTAWTPIRNSVNKAVLAKRGVSSETDPLSNNTNYWIVFNLVALLGEVDGLLIGQIISDYHLEVLASTNRSISSAEKELTEAGVLTAGTGTRSRTYVLAPPFDSTILKLLAEVQDGLSGLEQLCSDFAK